MSDISRKATLLKISPLSPLYPETDKDIGFSAKGAISIQAEEEITLTAKKGFSIESEDFAVKASKEINIEASKDMTLKGSGIALN